MTELIAFALCAIGFLFNSWYHAWTDMILSGNWERKSKLLWIGQRQHILKAASLLLIFASTLIGQPSWYNAAGWFIFSYGCLWNLNYSYWKLGNALKTDGQFLPHLRGFIDWRWDPSETEWKAIVIGLGVIGAVLSLL
jgi:hypothetical protein